MESPIFGGEPPIFGGEPNTWLRGVDLNHRPLGYEPNELPDCSTPHSHGSVLRRKRQIRVRWWSTLFRNVPFFFVISSSPSPEPRAPAASRDGWRAASSATVGAACPPTGPRPSRAAERRSRGADAPCSCGESRSARSSIRTPSPWLAAVDSRWTAPVGNSGSHSAPPTRRRRLAVVVLRLGRFPSESSVVIGQILFLQKPVGRRMRADLLAPHLLDQAILVRAVAAFQGSGCPASDTCARTA